MGRVLGKKSFVGGITTAASASIIGKTLIVTNIEKNELYLKT